MLVFFAVIGASAGGLQQLPTCWAMIGFLTIMVAVHWFVIASVGRVLGISRQALILGSNANIGGPATAASESSLITFFLPSFLISMYSDDRKALTCLRVEILAIIMSNLSCTISYNSEMPMCQCNNLSYL